jgi:hypothetical protein
MDTDLFLVLGILLCIIAIPSILNAFVAGIAPRAGGTMALAGLAMVLFALSMRPGGYSIAEVPTAFVHVFNKVVK